MIEIKNTVFTNCNYDLLKVFLCFINHLLPLRLKFASESFVTLEDNEKKGLITLEKDSNSYSRFKITKLILEPGASMYASELTNYVLARYRAMGANSFYAVVDENREDLIDIFKNVLNFRACAFEYLYKINAQNGKPCFSLKHFKKENSQSVCSFYNESINSFNRFLFSRQNYQFLNKCFKYVFYDQQEEKILGYFEVASKNKHDFYINFVIDCAYNIYIVDAIKFIYSKISQKTKKFNLYIKVKDYFLNSKELITILSENGLELVSKSRIFAKDFYREIKDENLFKNARIIFNDPTTA